MPEIFTQDARGVFTQTLVDMYSQRPTVMGYLRSLFTTKETNAKLVSIAVERNDEKIAVDVFRGTEGNRNTISKHTLKMILPPFYKEYFDATELDFYDLLLGNINAMVDENTFAQWLETVTDKLAMLQKKIDRATELQCAQVLQTGIILLNSDTNIDFKRDSASMPILTAGEYWSAATGDPVALATQGAKFLRTVGKAQTTSFTMILGESALNALLDNEKFKAKGDLRWIETVKIGMPPEQLNSLGYVPHGQFSAGSWRVNVFTYPEFYKNTAGTVLPYIGDKNMIMIPNKPDFTLAYGGVPKIMRDTGNAEYPEYISQQKGKYALNNYIDDRTDKHIFDIKSAPVAVPTAVDQIFSTQVLA